MPICVTADDTGRIYVSDSEAGLVNIYTPDGDFAGYLGGKGVMQRPTGIVFEKISRRIFVVDTAAHDIHVFDTEGNREFSFGKRGSGDGELNYPTFIAAGSDGKIYVTDAMNFRVQVFDNRGNYVSQFGKPGDSYADFNRPKGIAADSFGNVYVVDNAADMVKIFNSGGELLLFFGENGRLPGQFVMPAGIFIDSKNRIYVADTYNMRIQVFQLLKGDS